MAEKPAVFVFTTAYRPFIGGAEIAVQEITKRLSGRYRFFIITARMRRDLPQWEESPEGIIIRIGFGSPADRFLLPILGMFKAFGLLRKTKPLFFWCIMVSWASGAAYLVNIIRFWRRIPILLTLQEGDSEAHVKRRWLKMLELSWILALRYADRLQTISAYLYHLAERYGWRDKAKSEQSSDRPNPKEFRGIVIPNGVDTARFKKIFSTEEREAIRKKLGIGQNRVIITTSRLVEKNAVDVVIRAFAILAKDAPDISLVIVGGGEEEAALKTLAKSEGISDRVLFLGSRPNEEIPEYLAVADVFCRPSRSEGMGNSFIEAMAAGIPVVATFAGGIRDFLKDGENGLATKSDDPADCAEKMKKILNDRSLRQKLSTGGMKTAERYSWNDIAGKFGYLFSELTQLRKTGEPSGARRMGRRIVIAAPIYPPQIGGPATYAKRLAAELAGLGAHARVITYGVPSGNSAGVSFVPPNLPLGLKHAAYFLKTLRYLLGSGGLILLDPVSGVPAVFACLILRKPFVLRIEGDRLWESFVERTKKDMTLREFYRALPEKELSSKERMILRVAGFSARFARAVVFSSAWRRNIFLSRFLVSKAVIIPSPWPQPGANESGGSRAFLFAGRFIRLKNISRLISVFSRISNEWKLEIIGDGPERDHILSEIERTGQNGRVSVLPPLPSRLFRGKIGRARALLLPSLSDVSPRTVLEAIEVGTPFLLTRESGFAEDLRDIGLFCNPNDEADIQAKIEMLADEKTYRELKSRLQRFSKQVSWKDIADSWISALDCQQD